MTAQNRDTRALESAIRGLEASARLLDPGEDERAELWEEVGRHVHAQLRTLGGEAAYRPDTPVDPASLAVAETSTGIRDAVETLRAVEAPGVNQASGRHFAYIPGGGLFPSALGDLLAGVSNRYTGIRFASPAANALERSLVRWMADLVGYPESAGGDLTSGGSIAHLEGIVTARDAAGIRSADVPRTVVYLTSETHHCIEKGLRLAGLGECVVRRVALDERRRMRPHALAEAVDADVAAGLRPWLVVATAGTIDTGAVDPVDAIADVADAHGLWLQVDAAYGGFFLVTDHGRRLLAGIERSRSVVMDPHKGLFLPFGSGALVVREERELAYAHRYSAEYLSDARAAGGVFSPSDLSLELSRPFRALRLWLPLKVFGLAAFRAALDEKLLLARYVHARLTDMPGWEVGPEPELSVVTFRYQPARGDANDFNRRLVGAVYADGRTVISGTDIDGRYTLRLAVLHYRSHLDDVEVLLDVLAREARRLQDV